MIGTLKKYAISTANQISNVFDLISAKGYSYTTVKTFVLCVVAFDGNTNFSKSTLSNGDELKTFVIINSLLIKFLK